MTTSFSECSSEEFGRWLFRNAMQLPVPMNALPSVRRDIPVDDLLQWAAEDADRRVRVSNDTRRDELIRPEGWSRRLMEATDALAQVLRAPEWLCFATRSPRTASARERETFTVGLARGGEGAVVIDDGERVRIGPLRSTEVASTVAGTLLPDGFVLERFPVTQVSATRAREYAALPGGTAKLLRAARVSPDDIETVERIEGDIQVLGMLGAATFTDSGQQLGPLSATWFESGSGGLLTTHESEGSVTMEAVSPTSLTRALVHAVAAAQ